MKTSVMNISGRAIPVTFANTVIVGAGAAAMNCAVKLVEFWRDRGVEKPADRLLIVTGGVKLGASRMSGSDKQTYYKMGTSPRVPDTAEDFAKTLTAFGCCHGDNALIEGICSLRGFYHLVEAGVPFPHDPYGAFIGYKTDHDPYERATSAGPKTSKFMSECLSAQARKMGVKMADRHVVAKFITSGEGPDKRIVALLCFNLAKVSDSDMGLAVFVADNWVLAAGGPGEIYRDTVYPRGQYGIHGAALGAGLEACNLTESQYGLASTKFRWNVSGTYMQVVPRIYSTNAKGGDEREFLTEYFDDMPSMATNIFLKGYQWPFDAQRITDHRSSLIDMAVHQETVVRGRKVWMDFLRNPVGKDGWEAFRIDHLAPEAREYLEKTAALQERPIDRLAHMNGPAIDIYQENGIDLHREPLEIALCAQHHNGGFSVNKWWESSIPRTFVIGEMAGTHGVKRPGGSALNAGQVGAIRAAEFIANVYGAELPSEISNLKSQISDQESEISNLIFEISDFQSQIENVIQRMDGFRQKSASATVTPEAAMKEIGLRMTRYGAHLRWAAGAAAALAEAKTQYKSLMDSGLKLKSSKQLPSAIRAMQQCLTQVAMLKAICGMLDRGVGSRGSHCILDDSGSPMHPALTDPATGRPYCFKSENEALRQQVLCVRYNPDAPDLFDLRDVAPRPVPDRQIAFESAWTEYREGKVFQV